MFAAAKGHTDVVKLLIEAEVDVNTKNYWVGRSTVRRVAELSLITCCAAGAL